ncbi:zinc metalloprotease family m13 neprilysin-related [Holotrichia oblita]|uniref:Zinc metalloprotease family m13 neprilysin-related n=1 Tax=Holotrichia oblita TaxID=644536 RepID=A0ACB9SWS8_HOLOL|nr:zinc metalloprotease family m13 neprilysin-related [Holotrichia oblita]
MRTEDEYGSNKFWWKRRTGMERRLIIVAAITTSAMVGLLVALLVIQSAQKLYPIRIYTLKHLYVSDRYVVCDSPNCVRAANELLSYIDGDIAPCDDFYQFACGNFFRDTNSDDDKSSSMKEIMDNILINQIREMIEVAVKKDDKPSVAKTKAFYRGCMNESGNDSQALKIMRDILKDIGGWPTIDTNWKENDFEWFRATPKLRKYGYVFDLFLSIEIGINDHDENKHIIEVSTSKMAFTLKDLYIQAFITDDMKENVRAMTEIIRRRFDKRIKKFDWLDESGVERAKEKIASVVSFVADFDHVYHKIEAAYKNIEIHEDRFLLSLLQLRKIKKDLEYAQINEAVTHEREDKSRIYNFRENRLVIPVDYLHGIYYDIYRPNYMNYAALGAIIARELSNMFLEGRYYDVRGIQFERTSSESFVNYYNKLKCHQEQFVSFYVPEVKMMVNKSLIEEDLAEIAGLRLAYDAYLFWSSNNDLEANIPGLNYTQSQIFWITTVLQECVRDTPEKAEEILSSDNITLSRFRVNGALRNLEEFTNAFHCPLGTAMNPAKKCKMW